MGLYSYIRVHRPSNQFQIKLSMQNTNIRKWVLPISNLPPFPPTMTSLLKLITNITVYLQTDYLDVNFLKNGLDYFDWQPFRYFLVTNLVFEEDDTNKLISFWPNNILCWWKTMFKYAISDLPKQAILKQHEE